MRCQSSRWGIHPWGRFNPVPTTPILGVPPSGPPNAPAAGPFWECILSTVPTGRRAARAARGASRDRADSLGTRFGRGSFRPIYRRLQAGKRNRTGVLSERGHLQPGYGQHFAPPASRPRWDRSSTAVGGNQAGGSRVGSHILRPRCSSALGPTPPANHVLPRGSCASGGLAGSIHPARHRARQRSTEPICRILSASADDEL